jgi:hypothetical protein
MLARNCGVCEKTAYRWWKGARIRQRYAESLAAILGKKDAAAVYASFPAVPVGSGARVKDGDALIRSAAREMRARGWAKLAAMVERKVGT